MGSTISKGISKKYHEGKEVIDEKGETLILSLMDKKKVCCPHPKP